MELDSDSDSDFLIRFDSVVFVFSKRNYYNNLNISKKKSVDG